MEFTNDLKQALTCLDKTIYVVEEEGRRQYVRRSGTGDFPVGEHVLALAPPCLPDRLGDPSFCRDHHLLYPCYAGSMAHGIASEALVAAMGEAGMLGFFGSAGMSLEELEGVIRRLSGRMGTLPFGMNLINSPGDTDWEQGAVDLFLKHGVTLIEASAYLMPTPALVKFRVKGLTRDACGNIVAPNRIIAKVSRVEVAKRMLAPPPAKMVEKLLNSGEISDDEARVAALIPLAQDITAEADSGGHTDHRAALPLLPSMLRLAADIQAERRYTSPPRVGLAGGMGTPAAVAAAFAMGAAYIVTGSINQACLESGSSAKVREMLACAVQTDVADAPAADMFEMGIKVQVLKKGTRFAERASRLYELYRLYGGIEDIPETQRAKIEETIFRKPLQDIWKETEQFFKTRNPRQLERADKDPKYKMALVFRWYLGHASHWANAGTEDRTEDYQVWCGPSMGAFNDWTRDSFMEDPARRSAPLAALNLLYGAALLLRVQTLSAQGVRIEVPAQFPPPVDTLPEFMVTTRKAFP